MTTLDSDLLESVEKDYFDDPRVMALVNRFRCAQSEPVPVGHLVSPHGEFKPNFNFRFTFPPKSLDWSIPLYYHAPAKPAEPVPNWITYDKASDVLTIHGKKYAGSMFSEEGFLAPVGTLMRVEHSPHPETVTLAIVQPAQSEPVALWALSGHGYSPVFLEQAEPPEPLTVEEALAKGWRRFYSSPQPADPFSREAISVTQTAWKMGYDACKEEQATQPSTLPPLPKNLHSLAGNIWCSICEWADAEPGAEAGEAAKQINKALDAELLAYAKEALRLNGVNV